MSSGAGQEEAALDRLEGIFALYESADPEVQDAALERAQSFCVRQWGSYLAGLEALAGRVEVWDVDPIATAKAALRLREEAEDPGGLIRQVRSRGVVSAGTRSMATARLHCKTSTAAAISLSVPNKGSLDRPSRPDGERGATRP